MGTARTQIRRLDGAIVVEVTGEVNFEGVPAFHQELVKICAELPLRLIVDLAGVTSMDSSGVGALLDAYRRIRHAEGQFALVGLNSFVRSVFEVTRLDRLVAIHATAEDALQA